MDRRTRAATRLSATALIAIVGLVSACTTTPAAVAALAQKIAANL